VAELRHLLEAGVDESQWDGVGDDSLLAYAVREGNLEMVKVLLHFGADPNRRGREGATPLQMAVAMEDFKMAELLLDGGADSNQKFFRPVSGCFLALTKNETMRWFLRHERRLTPLMMAANNGDVKMIRVLLDHGAETEIRSGRYRLYPLNFASRRNDVKAMQVILGEDPENERYHIVLDLSDQQLLLYKNSMELVMSSRVSSGKAKFRTPPGIYVITDKHRSYRSKIYNVKMPYFQRLSCLGIGFHSGYCPRYPASHGCIRMPYPSAKKMFKMTPLGTRVVIQE
jgi:hypothetical protein